VTFELSFAAFAEKHFILSLTPMEFNRALQNSFITTCIQFVPKAIDRELAMLSFFDHLEGDSPKR